jgi:hypothetical protein
LFLKGNRVPDQSRTDKSYTLCKDADGKSLGVVTEQDVSSRRTLLSLHQFDGNLPDGRIPEFNRLAVDNSRQPLEKVFEVRPQLVLEHDARHPGHHAFKLDLQLVRWLASDIDAGSRTVLLESLEKGLVLLDQQRWETAYYPLTHLVFSLGYWGLSGRPTELSVRRFLVGLKFAFLEQGSASQGLRSEKLAAIEPLLARVPAAILQDVICQGRTFDDPVVRTICRLLVFNVPTTGG